MIATLHGADRAAFDTHRLACEPVVLRGLGAHLPLHEAARSIDTLIPYLLTFDSGASAQAFVGPPDIGGRYGYGDRADGFNFARETLALPAALARIRAAATGPGGESLYLGSLPAEVHLPGLAEANPLPLAPLGVRPGVWVGNASFVACHYDRFDNLACVMAGRRRFTLYPPDAIADLYVGPIDHTMAGQPVSLAAMAPDNDPRYPRFAAARARAQTVELEPGDALYLPKLWWHAVEGTAPFNLLLNYWWDGFATGPDSPYTAMLLAMTTLAERPAAERAAWRAYFDHYAFRLDGHPLAHLPPERHGILASSRENLGRIRAFVMQALRGG
ncbi:cupin-like domain-containing protein [Sphingomonas sp. HT-1]|uniref:cupin-like domain-containing protein n=1 Tax=unclassified Sphingomonas TaxID=196159 RepID=UPI0002DA8209|nr:MULTISPECIES: cupin-like domain-containing protein [unclassified Sphingomonas]KTF69667.1 transcriptional regulator [Sphingomonas sp. WG]